MTEPREHLVLPVITEQLPRRPRPGGGRAPTRDNPGQHGQTLLRSAEALADRLQTRGAEASAGINPRLLFRLRLHPRGNLSDDVVARMGLRVLAQDGNRRLVVFPNDATLTALRDRIAQYARSEDGSRFQEVAAIDAIEELTAADRTGPRLTATPLESDESEAVDVELWHPGSRDDALAMIDEIREAFHDRVEVTDQYVGASLCLMRVRLTGQTLSDLLNVDYVKEIDRRPAPWIALAEVQDAELGQYEVGASPAAEVVGVIVVDSGAVAAHPLLSPAIADSAAFPSRLAAAGDDVGDGDAEAGHGTSVAGIAVYGDIAACLNSRSFDPAVPVFVARVTAEGDQYDPDLLVETQLRSAVEYFVTRYAQAKVVNISLGDSRYPYPDRGLQFRFAALVDELAYDYRDREIVFVASVGNFAVLSRHSPEQALTDYPAYLLEPEARVIDPGTSAIALTVGGISPGEAVVAEWQTPLIDRDIAAPTWPSPFTRSGPGVQGGVKPDVVELAGTLRFARGGLAAGAAAGIPTTSNAFAPPAGQLLHMVVGTSFAAPKVANLAARLFEAFPGASSNLVRALIADSARVPPDRPPSLTHLPEAHPSILNLYGYGQPDYERARWSSDSRVLLIDEGLIDVDTFRLYEVPPIPEEFRESRGDGYISVTLAFDPPTRHTRSNDYVGIAMEYALFKNVTAGVVREALRRWTPDEQDELQDDLPGVGTIESNRVKLEPGNRIRSRGTLQRGVERVANRAWRYDGRSLVLAMTCRRRWAPVDIGTQRYALVVSVRHSSPVVLLYDRIRARTRLYERARVRVGG
jgi:hypothetical protein